MDLQAVKSGLDNMLHSESLTHTHTQQAGKDSHYNTHRIAHDALSYNQQTSYYPRKPPSTGVVYNEDINLYINYDSTGGAYTTRQVLL